MIEVLCTNNVIEELTDSLLQTGAHIHKEVAPLQRDLTHALQTISTVQKHWKSNYAVWYAKFIPRHTWCIKDKNHKHTLCINSFYLRTFSKKKKSSFWGPSASFFARGICKKSSPFFEMLSYAPILWIFHSLLFFFQLACSLFF